MATAEGKPGTMENNPLPPDAKVWVLRVSIHCEGCKKKVIKIMNKIKGVYKTEVDMNQHKVTVVGNVEVETLIRSLEKKKGRNWKVELWPQPENSEKNQSRSKNREKQPKQQQEQEQSKEAPDNGEKKPKAALQEKSQLGPPTEAETSSKKIKNGGGSKDGGETSENGVKETAGEDAKTAEAKKGETGPAGIQLAAAAEKPSTAAAVEKIENGVGSEDKKGQNGNNTNIDNVEEGGRERVNESSRSRQLPPGNASMDLSPGLGPGRVHNEYSGSFLNPPPHYYMPPLAPPAYTVSYHATSSGYGTSYYGPPPPGSSYAYMHPGQEIEAYNPYPYANHESTDVFERFSDENPNACSIM